jgi:hypothetical protein
VTQESSIYTNITQNQTKTINDTFEIALVSRPVIFLHILAARAVDEGGNSLITVFKPAYLSKIISLVITRFNKFYMTITITMYQGINAMLYQIMQF